VATDTLCGDCPHCAHWQGGHYCERHREFLRYGDDQPLRCKACVRGALKARVAELEAHPTITRETLIADVIAQETPEEQARAIWWLRDVADEAADTLGLTYAEPCAGDGCDGVALDSTESALCAECAAERGLGA